MEMGIKFQWNPWTFALLNHVFLNFNTSFKSVKETGEFILLIGGNKVNVGEEGGISTCQSVPSTPHPPCQPINPTSDAYDSVPLIIINLICELIFWHGTKRTFSDKVNTPLLW